MVKFILVKSPDEWATTKQACRDELVVYLFFSPIYIYRREREREGGRGRERGREGEREREREIYVYI